MFRRIAIVNRGEAAMRLINAVRELNAEQGTGIETVALYTEAERTAMFVREADLAHPLGPAANRPYLDHAVLERALIETEADAAWVGWGFVAEDPGFAELCERIGVTFIGPSPEAMRKLGDKIGSKLIAEEVGVPVAAWSRGALDTLDDALAVANQIGYPVMLKATAGGGGRGIRVIESDAELRDAYQRTRDEAERAFGSGVVFLERLVTGARHVEVQVIADGQGTAWALGVRDCSVQRRNQKIIEESASPVLDPGQVAELKASAERLALAVGYCGAGTVEFLYHPDEKLFAFLEVNTRLQVEHPITEATRYVDLVRLQLRVAAGERLTEEPPPEIGHAVEARLNAEDPDRDFAPSPGRIVRLDLPRGPGIRVDTGVGEGDTIPADFDSMIAKIIAYGRTRDEALGRLRRAVADTTVVLDGGTTNKSFILELLGRPEVITGGGTGWADTGWIDRVRAQGELITHRHSGVALVAAGIEAYQEAEALERQQLLVSAFGGRPQVQHEAGRAIDVKLRGAPYRLAVARIGPRRYRVTVRSGDELSTVDAELERYDSYEARLSVAGQRFRLITATHGPVHFVEVDGVTHRVTRDEGGVLRSPVPALVVATPVAVGAEVEAGAPVLVLESMKMETVVPAPFRAVVRELSVSTGTQVETGAPLIRLEPLGEEDLAAESSASVDLELPAPAAEPGPAERLARGYEDLRSMLLGFDLDPRDEGRALTEYFAARAELPEPPMDSDSALLRLFADVADLSRNRPAGEELDTELRVHTPRELFHAYLQTLDVERAALPESFVGRLSRVLGHYGITDLDRSEPLVDAVFRIFLAQQRVAPDVRLVTSLLERWLVEPRPAPERTEETHAVLDHLVLSTQLRFPEIGDLARSVRFRWFDQPQVDEDRAEVLAGVRSELADLAAHPHARDYAKRVEALATIPEQLIRFLTDRLERGVPRTEPMLEVLIRRHYLEYGLHDVANKSLHGRPFTMAGYELDDRKTYLVSTVGTVEELASGRSTLVRDLKSAVGGRPSGYETVADLYLHWPEAPTDVQEASDVLRELVAALPFRKRMRRIAIAVAAGDGRPVFYFTYRPQRRDLVEDENVRGVHPMVGRRLNLWRLRDFMITRLDAPEDVLLYHCVARENPADVRLVALAQVRQFAVVRDDDGLITSLPHVERAIANCLEGIRRARTERPDGAKLDMNHVWVTVWPVIDAEVAELTALERNITPLTVGAGIEEVLIQGRVTGSHGDPLPVVGRFYNQPGAGVQTVVERPPTEPLLPLDDYAQKVVRARRRNTVYPYELAGMIAGTGGSFVEHDLKPNGTLAPVKRPRGQNTSAIIAGVVSTPTRRYPKGLTRVVLLGDPTKALGALAEPECARIIAALDLATKLKVPVEWFALSSGAKISMDSGTENMDWVAKALKRIVEFTQAGGEINIVVAGINVGAQPYWNAEATMLMHTKGILIMTPDSAMVLTGKQSLDFSGGVSAEDNFGIGGYDRVMGPNGQAQYWAPDLAGARDILLSHYDYTYLAPGESTPRRAETTDPYERDVTAYPHDPGEGGFRTVGEIFSPATNPDRKKAFNIRTVMRAVADLDHPVLERWAGMADAETAVVQDARLGGLPVCLIGIESKPVPRRGFPPTDGPDTWTAGTLFPRSSKKVARAINAASGNRPLVVLANLSGFDGSPDSMRNLQLEYGAEIGRAIVNFRGPIVFCVISRYHGGAFVVFSKALNPKMTVLAVEGSFASVIGGAPAAAVVFAGDVRRRIAADPRVIELEARLAEADEADRAGLAAELAELRAAVRTEKIGEVADEFDQVHSIRRAVEVGSVDAVITPEELRPQLINAIERGLKR
ncbi:ATP-binding protein [Microlunatus parietis]|uniref:Acetyl/propionyl-CoA carboxylase alpha subunit/acetyl-CoA carboxylase carboxyltransferase component n=1 Tax=Microlunatus parietis TaxID=682979 RepID=A0A7Y9LA46_9ACTN|nr:carboxyl transferase domain-containing protein [Microlunatus parietis]NYE72479.1 acetyl/propionyl-CoA carboxylase alpha subunit/acetyl-CoA carboxylase carboxyltransferase component [Microlunatus parietis]